MKNFLRTLFIMMVLFTGLQFDSQAQAQEYMGILQFNNTFSYSSNINQTNVSYVLSLQNCTSSVIRNRMLETGLCSNVVVTPLTSTNYRFDITFQAPINLDKTYHFFIASGIRKLNTPEGEFHFKDFTGWYAKMLKAE